MTTFTTPKAIYQGHKSIADIVLAALGDYHVEYNVGDIVDDYLASINAALPDGVIVYDVGATINAATEGERNRLMDQARDGASSVSLCDIIDRHGMITEMW